MARQKKLIGTLGPRLAALRQPTSSAIDQKHAEAGSYYLERRHGLIHRHIETMSLHSDQSARWRLGVDLELPNGIEAQCGRHNGECLFLFPLLFLRKSDRRTGFDVRGEENRSLPLLTRAQSTWVSSVAAAHAGNRLLEQAGHRPLDVRDLQPVIASIASEKPYDASVKLKRLFRTLRENYGGHLPQSWDEEGFTTVLRLLVEHSLAWVTLGGRPGQRRLVTIEHDIELVRRPFLRWRFGSISDAKKEKQKEVLETGEKDYGRRGYRISLGVLGERVGQPLAWMPIEFDFPTIYTRRCRSYHFELLCPPGLTPRNLKISEERSERLDSPPKYLKGNGSAKPRSRPNLKARTAHQYLPGSPVAGDLSFRVTVGVGAGTFPVLWSLAASLTALLLWTLAATDPKLGGENGSIEVAAAILLVIPALLGVLIIGAEDGSVSQLLSGSRILLLVCGLSAVGGAGVLIGATPLGLTNSWTWTVCAMVATAATVPLATSWLLSIPGVWKQLKEMRSAQAHYIALAVGIVLAGVPIAVLTLLGAAPTARIAVGGLLLLITVGMILLANNRTGVEIGDTRHYVAFALFLAATTCLALACTELRAAIEYDENFQHKAEFVALALLLLSPIGGLILRGITKPFDPKRDEVHLAPDVAKALIAKERIVEFVTLRQRENALARPDEATEVS